MHKGNSILIRAPLDRIFETAANLEDWPKILPHYRYIHYIDRGTDRHVVKMACHRSGIPISWVSEQIIDRERREVRFHHLRAFTKGMDVVWTFSPQPGGEIRVQILHDLRFRIPVLSFLAEPIIGGFFISHVAGQTLLHMKKYLENESGR